MYFTRGVECILWLFRWELLVVYGYLVVRAMTKEMLSGYAIELSEDRAVWVGKRTDGGWQIQFKNKDLETALNLSQEVADALVKLLTNYPQRIERVRITK